MLLHPDLAHAGAHNYNSSEIRRMLYFRLKMKVNQQQRPQHQKNNIASLVQQNNSNINCVRVDGTIEQNSGIDATTTTTTIDVTTPSECIITTNTSNNSNSINKSSSMSFGSWQALEEYHQQYDMWIDLPGVREKLGDREINQFMQLVKQ